ncbi:MAG: GHKL domain-containing protein [Oscillospiraceae bacterium]|nr:GHKL domain-containing protein [Oscillospiraceae bacterium]
MIIAILYAIIPIIGIYIVAIHEHVGKIKQKACIVAFCMLIILAIIMYFMLPEYISENIFANKGIIICIIIYMVTISGCSKRQTVYIAFLLFGLILIVTTAVQWTGSVIYEESLNYGIVDLLINIIFLVTYAIAVRYNVQTKIIANIVKLRVSMKMLLIISVWASALLSSFSTYLFQAYFGTLEFLIMGTISIVLITLVGVMCPMLIIYSMSSLHYKNLSTIMEKQVMNQVEHYETTSKMNEDIKRFRHDYRNLLIGLTAALKRNDTTGALDILKTDEMMLTKAESANAFNTGDIVLDALLSEKQQSATKVNASIVFDGIMPGKQVSPVDICIIFGNALDNAIEACAGFEYDKEKTIAIKSSYSNGFIFIKIENPTVADVQITDNNIVTTKENKNAHGIGLNSIRTAVDKYFGKVTLSQENGIFCLEIDLDLNMLV